LGWLGNFSWGEVRGGRGFFFLSGFWVFFGEGFGGFLCGFGRGGEMGGRVFFVVQRELGVFFLSQSLFFSYPQNLTRHRPTILVSSPFFFFQ